MMNWEAVQRKWPWYAFTVWTVACI